MPLNKVLRSLDVARERRAQWIGKVASSCGNFERERGRGTEVVVVEVVVAMVSGINSRMWLAAGSGRLLYLRRGWPCLDAEGI